MWIMTQEGFFSIVQHRNKENHVLIRARRAEHLTRLLDAYWDFKAWGERPRIIRLKNADYAVRLEVPEGYVCEMVRRAAAAIDYSDFKGSIDVDEAGNDSYLGFLHQVWVLARQVLQRGV